MNDKIDEVSISDRLFITDKEIEVRFITVSPSKVVAYKKSDDIFKYNYLLNTTEELLVNVNEQVALVAREWVVSRIEESLDKYIHQFESEEYFKSLESDEDKVVYTPIKSLKKGYDIPEE